MKEKTSTKLLFDCFILSLLLVFTTSSLCSAQDWSRAGKGEVFGIFGFLSGDKADYPDEGVFVEVDDSTLYGFGFGYNFDDHFNLNTDFLFGSADVDGGPIGGSVAATGDTDVIAWNANLDYNVLKGRLTPVVSGGIGVFSVDGDAEGPGLSVTFSDSSLSYNFGLGARWDLEQNISLKAMYRWLWADVVDEDMTFDGFYFSVGVLF